MTILALFILILASFRLTRIIVDDSITDFFRDRLIDWHQKTHSPLSHWILTLFTCFWCIGFWISGITTFIYSAVVIDWPGFVEFGLLWLAVAGGSAITATVINKLEEA